jgi:virginiamycin B lyase
MSVWILGRGLAPIAALVLVAWLRAGGAAEVQIQEYSVPSGSRPHDVAPATDGTVWYTSQPRGVLGRLDPSSGNVEEVALGDGASPHGVIVGPDGAAWVTDGGLNAIVRVDRGTRRVTRFPLPERRGHTNLNTAAFDGRGVLWFTGQNGIYGRLDPRSGALTVFDAPGGRGPYGIATTPRGEVFYASLAGSHIAQIDVETGRASVVTPPTPDQGARRVWADSRGQVWVSEWNSGNVSRYDPASRTWKTWRLPGARPRAYAVYVDERDDVWVSDWGANAMVRFHPPTETFTAFPSSRPNASVRQILGRPGEVWAPESGADRLVVFRTR